MKLLLILFFNHTKKNLNQFPFLLYVWTWLLLWTQLCLYLDKRRRVQENTSIRYREFPWAAPLGTPSTSCWYFPVLPSSRLGTDSMPYLARLNYLCSFFLCFHMAFDCNLCIIVHQIKQIQFITCHTSNYSNYSESNIFQHHKFLCLVLLQCHLLHCL